MYYTTVRDLVVFVKARGLGKEDDKAMLTKASQRMGGTLVSPDTIVKIENIELQVSYNPYVQLFTRTLGGIAVVLNGTNEVYVDNNFRNMTGNAQYATLCHETGHIIYNHRADYGYAFKRLKAVYIDHTVLQMELEADEYAAVIVGPNRMISALYELGMIDGICKREVAYRIRSLKNNYDDLMDKHNHHSSNSPK